MSPPTFLELLDADLVQRVGTKLELSVSVEPDTKGGKVRRRLKSLLFCGHRRIKSSCRHFSPIPTLFLTTPYTILLSTFDRFLLSASTFSANFVLLF